MKITTLIFIFLIPFSLFAQMEFEEVFDLETERRIMDIKDVHFFSDSILIIAETYLDNETQRRYNYFLSPDNGDTWNILTDKLLKNHSQIRQDKPIGKYQVGRGTFVRFNLPEKDTSISFIDLEGNIKIKIPYPYIGTRMEFSDLLLNPLDENFIGIHHNYYEFQVDTYFHNIGYTTNLGENWNSIQPEEQLKSDIGISLSKTRKITPFFSVLNKKRMLIFFEWFSRSDYYRHDAIFDLESKTFEFNKNTGIYENFICFECNGKGNIDHLTSDYRSIFTYNFYTKSDEVNINGYSMLNLNRDSVDSLGEIVYFGFASFNNISNYRIDLTNQTNRIIRLQHLSSEENNPDFFNQYFFKSTNSGNTWEFIFSNDGTFEPITKFGIIPNNGKIWIRKAKNRDSIPSDYSTTDHSIEISKEPITSVDSQLPNLSLLVILKNNTLIISSLEPKNNSKITVYNLQGKEIYSNSHDLVKGENQIGLNQILNNGMYLVKITSNVNESLVFKLLRVE